jgi:Ca-activated chloride channel family protein
MSQSNSPEHDELDDRLMDQALREVLGGERPPDLFEKILAAAADRVTVAPRQKEPVMNKPKSLRRIAIAAVCTAMCIFLAMLITSAMVARYSFRLTEVFPRDPSPQTLPAPYYLRDGVDFFPSTAAPSPEGRGPGQAGDRYERVTENPFRLVKNQPLSTFSIDVDTASYANVRRFLLSDGRMPPPDAVRIEDLVNYFDYDYAGPKNNCPFAANIEVAACPWNEGHRLVRIGLKGREIENAERPASNLVFLLDVSGSMDSPDKLPLLVQAMKLLVAQLRETDRVAIVVYASSEGVVLPSTPGSEPGRILAALDSLHAGGSTAGGAGIDLAYRLAQENFIRGGANRVILCTDGDFNVGVTSEAALERMVEERAKSGVFLSVLGFGRGNLNDAMMERISNKGNGNYAYIDGLTEARKVLVQQAGGTLVTIAKDVKLQVEFNPSQVAAYRLIGYENRILAAEDFNDDKKEAGEIGAGHTVTAYYELIPPGAERGLPDVDPLRYQTNEQPRHDAGTHRELLTLKIRYKDPESASSERLEFTAMDEGNSFDRASLDFRFAAAVASFGMLLRDSQNNGTATYDSVLEIASSAKGQDLHGYRSEFLEMIRRAKALAGR